MRGMVSCCLARRALLLTFLSGTSWSRPSQTSTLLLSSRKTHKQASQRRQQLVSRQLLTVCCTDLQRVQSFTAVSQSGSHVNRRRAGSTTIKDRMQRRTACYALPRMTHRSGVVSQHCLVACSKQRPSCIRKPSSRSWHIRCKHIGSSRAFGSSN